MHDDQHGTAVVLLAALHNALKVVGKRHRRRSRWWSTAWERQGRHAAAFCWRRACDLGRLRSQRGRCSNATGEHLAAVQKDLRGCISFDRPFATLQEALTGADVFIGVSVANILQRPRTWRRMAADRIVFAMANPEPEIAPELAVPLCRVLATGRADYPNQVNNLLAFPGIFRGALDVRAERSTSR